MGISGRLPRHIGRSLVRPIGGSRTARATATALLLAGALAPIGAGTASAHTFGPHSAGIKDSNWGGYVAQGSFSKVTGSWVEPHATCNSSNDLFAPWVGLDGYGSQTVEQTGVQTDCSSGSPVLSAWYEMYPAAPVYWNDPVSEGDHFTASVVSQGNGAYTLTLTDDTQGWTETTEQSLDGRNASVEAVIESPTQSYPSFDRLDFSNVTVDGQPLDAVGPQPLTSGGYSPGALQGGSFTMTPGGPQPHTPHNARPPRVRS
ncbi:G1 family glutamic endopeptidase [Streptomyces orinoci]|uniref:G1 family glutamic endopeptidase n=1 Tax=Streptomyces orinoci TaxID=67339 RepID=A0ABV3K5D9_STRON|nr:G1 family glutamic endopeptidase [Streptomyces orinoci]